MDSDAVAFRVAKEDLAGAVMWVAKNIPTKPADAVLRMMLVTADDEGLTLCGYDRELSAEARVTAEVETTGRFAVAGRMFADIVQTLPESTVDISVEGSTAVITSGSARFELPTVATNDYPPLPKLPANSGTVDTATFCKAVTQVAKAAGRDETLAMLTGVHAVINGSVIEMAATDRFRMALRRFDWAPNHPEVTGDLLIPARRLLETVRSIDAVTDPEIALSLGDGEELSSELLGFTINARKITTRMLSADFPNVYQLLPKTLNSVATVNIEQLLGVIKRLSLMAKSSAQIRFDFEEGSLKLSSGGSDSGHAEETLDCAYVGDPMTTGFNPTYLREGLEAMDTERVLFGFTRGSRPALLIPATDDDLDTNDEGEFICPDAEFSYILMPVRIAG